MVEQLSFFFPAYLLWKCTECQCEMTADIWGAEIFQLYPLQDHTTTAVPWVLPQITSAAAWQAVLSLEKVTCTQVYLRGVDRSGLSVMTIEIKALKKKPLHL